MQHTPVSATLSMPVTRRPFIRVAVAALLTILLLGLVAPFINAAAFTGNIQRALEASLGRKVDFEKAYFTLFAGPGFSLQGVMIHEDPNYGLEAFAYAPELKARLRMDKLLFGQIRFASLRLVEPSLNLVKKNDGTWNVLDLLQRLSSTRGTLLNPFPAVEVSDGRIDFKFGTRKTTLYIADSDVSIYPQRSGKVYVQFSGSPARTDRAGIGFGYLHGNANWYVKPSHKQANLLEADVTLDPSNLSELTTLIEGHDIGVHGRVSSHAHIEGPAAALHVSGELRLEDVHRWDLLPASGDNWQVRYQGVIDLLAHRLDLQTLPAHSGQSAPVLLQVRVNDFLKRPSWSLFTTLHKAPIEGLLPLARRMGLALPDGLAVDGSLDGVVGYSDSSGLAGGIALTNAVAKLPNIPPLRSAAANITISAGKIHIDPAILQADVGGTLRAGGDYDLSTQRLAASVKTDEFPIASLKNTMHAWFGSPAALAALVDGYITGQFAYDYRGSSAAGFVPAASPPAAQPPASWSGQFQFSNATIVAPGLAIPLKHAQGRATFDAGSFDLARFSALLGVDPIGGSYRYSLLAKHPEHVHLEMPSADLGQIEAALDPALQEQSLLSRLPFTRRSIPLWLAARNAEGDINIGRFSINHVLLGSLSSHLVWQGTNLQFANLLIGMPQGKLRGSGAVNLAGYLPRSHFAITVDGFPWAGGVLHADGSFQTSGVGIDSLLNLQAIGSFEAQDVTLSASDAFDNLSGQFDLSFAGGWPNLRLSKLEASLDDDDWSGEGISRKDGTLLLELGHGGRQLHLVSALR